MVKDKTAQALVFCSPARHFELRRYPLLEPGPGQVGLTLFQSGICGTDMHFLHGTLALPPGEIVLGHEFVGRIDTIGAGADCIMSGSFFSGTTESPGEIITINNKQYKEYRGMASLLATVKKMSLDGSKVEEIIHVEGEMTKIPYKGSIIPIINKLLGGLASGMTYVGAKDIESLKGKADFIEISSAGYHESQAHGLNQTPEI